jgi:transcriptional regulator with XRE-family HTH domain
MNEFQTTLSTLLQQSGKSLTQVALLGGVDRAYLLRLLNGSKENPSLETLFRIWMGLSIDPDVVKRYPTFPHGLSELVMAAGMSTVPSKLAEVH